VIRTEDANLLESAHSAVVGTVDAGGVPDASRAWGMRVDAAAGRLRALLPADEPRLRANLGGGGRIAVNLTHVLTLESIQVKGVVEAIEPATAEDREHHAAYFEAFAANVRESDGSTRELVLNLRPAELMAVTVAVTEVYDQTPGPSAGAKRP
jgi:hypothetical protein